MQELRLLDEKLDLLLKKYAALQDENMRLRENVSEQLQAIEQLNARLAVLETDMLSAQSQAPAGNGDTAAIRKQLDNVIGEIDKILLTLHD
jgi:cell division septum initiation protein DivIVA